MIKKFDSSTALLLVDVQKEIYYMLPRSNSNSKARVDNDVTIEEKNNTNSSQ